MKRQYSRLAFALFLICFNAHVNLHAAVRAGRWTAAYVGIDQTKVTTDGRHASVAYVMRIDLKAPGISFISTPHAGTKETISETTKDFAKEQHLQLAINAGFFAPCCSDKPEEKDINGLAISAGEIVSPPSSDGTYVDALEITRDNHATIAPISAGTNLSNIFTALTGSAVIVRDGRNTGAVNKLNKAAYGNPRTVVGLSRNGRYLYLVAIDGRKPGYSFGTTNTESADIMIALGAYTALNLDGGGSTTMARQDKNGNVVTVNRPSGGADRLVAESFGVHAQLLPH